MYKSVRNVGTSSAVFATDNGKNHKEVEDWQN